MAMFGLDFMKGRLTGWEVLRGRLSLKQKPRLERGCTAGQ